jgi:cysteinyl-tRNA synthetase
MSLEFYNTLTRTKEIFKPINKNFVGVYGCGPTVYWYQHIGNLRRYIFEDILTRTLLFNKYKIKHYVNVTDVGHLTSDADEGEDKIEKAAKKENKSANEVTKFYFNSFIEDLKKLNFTMPDKWLWATEYINEQIKIVKVLEEKGFTYKTKDGIYFDTSKLKDYGKLANLNLEGLEKAKRVKFGKKKNKTDFALWKFSEKGIRQQEWNSPWGIGFPGWHIECSAMSTKYLGKQFDIHTGGIDHIQIHHTNEIAQSESAFGKKPWVKFWLHSGHLRLKEGKMSKSSGDILRLKDLEKKGYSALDFRYLVLSTHYRKPLIFSFENLDSAKNSMQSLRNILSDVDDTQGCIPGRCKTPNTLKGTRDFSKKSLLRAKINKKYLKEFSDAVNDDLNLPKALQILWKLVRDKNAEGKIKTIKKMDEVFGLDLLKSFGDKKMKIPKEILDLVEEREKARREKDWKKSDFLRSEIHKKGYSVDDTEDGTRISRREN